MTATSRPAVYSLQQGSELSGVSEDALWGACTRMGIDPESIPSPLVQELRFLVGSVVDAVVAKACSGRPAVQEVAHG